MNVGSVLSAAMEQKHINQTALAQQVGVSQSYISQICSGRKVSSSAISCAPSGKLGLTGSAIFFIISSFIVLSSYQGL